MGGTRSLARRGLHKTIFAWAAMVTFCASSAAVTYGDDASAQTRKKKPKKPVSTEIGSAGGI